MIRLFAGLLALAGLPRAHPFAPPRRGALAASRPRSPTVLRAFDRATTPVVVCPGFGNDVVDYVTPMGQPEDVGLCAVLRRRGFRDVSVVPVARWEWLRVAGAWGRASR